MKTKTWARSSHRQMPGCSPDWHNWSGSQTALVSAWRRARVRLLSKTLISRKRTNSLEEQMAISRSIKKTREFCKIISTIQTRENNLSSSSSNKKSKTKPWLSCRRTLVGKHIFSFSLLIFWLNSWALLNYLPFHRDVSLQKQLLSSTGIKTIVT